MTKYLTRSNLREEEVIWLIVQGLQSRTVGKAWEEVIRLIVQGLQSRTVGKAWWQEQETRWFHYTGSKE